jgi:adenylylsulfate kinase
VPFFEVHVATPLAVCAARDVKGLYARQQAGTMSGLTGVDDDYEEPANPALRIDTTDRTIDDVVDELLNAVVPTPEGILL